MSGREAGGRAGLKGRLLVCDGAGSGGEVSACARRGLICQSFLSVGRRAVSDREQLERARGARSGNRSANHAVRKHPRRACKSSASSITTYSNQHDRRRHPTRAVRGREQLPLCSVRPPARSVILTPAAQPQLRSSSALKLTAFSRSWALDHLAGLHSEQLPRCGFQAPRTGLDD